MDNDDIIYAILLVISLVTGHFVKIAVSSVRRQFITAAVGVAMVAVVCREHGLHSLFTAVVNALIVLFISPRFCHWVSFIFCFGYIAFFRTTQYFGLPPVLPHANAVQLFLTLRMVGLAFEIHDTVMNREELTKLKEEEKPLQTLKNKYQFINPSFGDILAYSFCYIGLLTGPYYKYRTYYDMLHNSKTVDIDTLKPLFARLKYVPFIGGGFLLASHYFSIQYVRSEEFYTDNPLWYRIFYMVPMFFIFRTRLYVAWIMSECMCMTAALGAYPAISKPRCGTGPTNFEALELHSTTAGHLVTEKPGDHATISDEKVVAYDFETVHNLDVYGCELAPTVREGMRAWNMTVQYWLATYVYKRVTLKSGPVRVAITMTVSAFWHGVHPGYYLSFLTIPPSLIAEEMMAAAFRGSKEGSRSDDGCRIKPGIFDWCCWFFKMRSFEYMSMSFLLLGFSATLRYWYSIYFLGHVYILAFIAVGYAFRPRRSKNKRDVKVE